MEARNHCIVMFNSVCVKCFPLYLLILTTFSGVFEMPEYGKALSQDRQCIPLTVVFNDIKEPRELGTLFHAASVVGCERIVTTKGITVIFPILGLLYK